MGSQREEGDEMEVVERVCRNGGGDGCGRWGEYCYGDGVQDARCRSEKSFCDG